MIIVDVVFCIFRNYVLFISTTMLKELVDHGLAAGYALVDKVSSSAYVKSWFAHRPQRA